MKNKEITLINLPNRTASLMKHGYQVSNYGKLGHVLKSIKYRIEHDFNLPDFFVVNNENIDSSEFGEFNKALQKLNVQIPTVVLDELPSPEKMRIYQKMGAGDYLNNDASDESILRQLKRLDKSDTTKLFSGKKRSYIRFEKRVFDIFFSSLILVMISPLLLIIMLAIRLESKGPIFYWQQRVGAGYRIFNFYKFRSMRVDADQMIDNLSNFNHYGQQEATIKSSLDKNSSELLVSDDKLVHEDSFIQEQNETSKRAFKKFENDPRITKVGHWIRKTSIDELPQLINVLIGDMSLVGNRPLPLYEAETLTSDDWTERFMAPAGITGLWQVTERGKKVTSTDSRKQLDNEYARNHNLLMDIKILIKTPLAAIQQENV